MVAKEMNVVGAFETMTIFNNFQMNSSQCTSWVWISTPCYLEQK